MCLPDDVKNLSQIWAVAPALVKLALRDVQRGQKDKEFISKEFDLWAFMHDVTLDFSRPGKPTDNAYIESFNGKFRVECLNTNWSLSLNEAQRKCEAWRRDYNEVRPHSAIDNRVPAALHRTAGRPASQPND